MKLVLFLAVACLLLSACQSQISVLGGAKIGAAKATLPKESVTSITTFVSERFGRSYIWDGPFAPDEAKARAAIRDSEGWRAFSAADTATCYYVVYEECIADIDFVGGSRHGRAFAPCGVFRFPSDAAHAAIYKTEANQALQHNDPSCHVSCLRTPHASRGRG